jgi:hypothetical protein
MTLQAMVVEEQLLTRLLAATIPQPSQILALQLLRKQSLSQSQSQHRIVPTVIRIRIKTKRIQPIHR